MEILVPEQTEAMAQLNAPRGACGPYYEECRQQTMLELGLEGLPHTLQVTATLLCEFSGGQVGWKSEKSVS